MTFLQSTFVLSSASSLFLPTSTHHTTFCHSLLKSSSFLRPARLSFLHTPKTSPKHHHPSQTPIATATAPSTSTSSSTLEDETSKLAQHWYLSKASPLEVIEHALTTYSDEVAIAFSGAEDVVLIEYASQLNKPYRVFSLDTGRLHPETYRFYSAVEKHYGIKIEYTFPEASEVTELVSQKGMFSFYEDGHQECCRIRKVRPLRKKLGTLRAWITGQRKDQSPGTRAHIPLIQVDSAFKGKDEGVLMKYNPLSTTSSRQVWNAIRSLEVPYNELHNRGFVSIGCEPCTRPVLPNQHEREGRWWWEEATQKECGLHKGNLEETSQDDLDIARKFVESTCNSDKIVIYTKKGCHFCEALKNLLKGMGADYSEYVITEMENYTSVVRALEEKTGRKTAPNLWIGGKHIGGNETAQRWNKNGQLKKVLEEAGVELKASV